MISLNFIVKKIEFNLNNDRRPLKINQALRCSIHA